MNIKILLMVSLVAVSACSEEYSDLQSWMSQTRQEAKSHLKPVEPPKKIEPVTYFAPPSVGVDAFNPQRMKAAFQNAHNPNLSRPKEILENYGLDSLKYVGYIGSGSRLRALIQVDGHVYTVGVGNYLGQNFGQIVRITPDAIQIAEQVEDVYGKWTRRDTKLSLNGSADSASGPAN